MGETKRESEMKRGSPWSMRSICSTQIFIGYGYVLGNWFAISMTPGD